jgi:hypothetical protein
MAFTPDDLVKLRNYLERKFKNKGFTLKIREKAEDSIEVMLDGEFIALIYKDEDEGETSYDLNMAILDIDLSEHA